MIVQIEGLNLEKLLREAQNAGICLRAVRRTEPRRIQAQISPRQKKDVDALCARFGWTMEEIADDFFLRAARFAWRRPMLLIGAALGLALIALSSRMLLRVEITGADAYGAQVRRVLAGEGVRPGQLKRAVHIDALREELLLRLPGIKQASLRFSGSVLVVECHLARDGEQTQKVGAGLNLVAAQDGVVTRIVVSQGTPAVSVGDAVYAGQVLVRGEERTAQGGVVAMPAQGTVTARVWAHGEAKASLAMETASKTGRTRTRVTLGTPFFSCVVRPAQPFEEQDTIVTTQRIVDLFIPLWRRIEVFEEVTVARQARSQADAASQAQGAAENLAKKQLAAGVLILDKWVDYSMIDNEFVCASVVLEYERDIAVRPDQ